ncbi:TetR/AcrR family transcriptional regulator [Mycolicibacter sinensis]|uniref:TetR/AcrR family transcriptional regulator n=1 Tax=Mycolicibacter sinensis (strain JDM601) TaxID=875328 RepID=UPI0010422B1D|nr:TetR/AcrR family transcriptional regulator [Mycolicibacter sinensis]
MPESSMRDLSAVGSGRSWFVDILMKLGSVSRPSASLDPLIDATERAVSRNGVRRTTMSDLAREMKVARTTLYRQVDSVDDAILLAGARSMYRFLDELAVASLAGTAWSTLFVDTLVHVVAQRYENPLVRRMFEHEPELLGELLSQGRFSPVISRLASVAAPVLETAIAAGQLRAADPTVMGESWLRMVIGLMLCPPAGDIREIVEFMVAPVLAGHSGGVEDEG